MLFVFLIKFIRISYNEKTNYFLKKDSLKFVWSYYQKKKIVILSTELFGSNIKPRPAENKL